MEAWWKVLLFWNFEQKKWFFDMAHLLLCVSRVTNTINYKTEGIFESMLKNHVLGKFETKI